MFKGALLVLMLGVPAFANAASPFEAMRTQSAVTIKVHYGQPSHVRHYDGWGDGRINQMQYVQQKRIREGARSGELTRNEARRLLKEQDRIAKLESRYKSDGRLSPSERNDLERALNRSGKRIYNEKHDRQYRG